MVFKESDKERLAEAEAELIEANKKLTKQPNNSSHQRAVKALEKEIEYLKSLRDSNHVNEIKNFEWRLEGNHTVKPKDFPAYKPTDGSKNKINIISCWNKFWQKGDMPEGYIKSKERYGLVDYPLSVGEIRTYLEALLKSKKYKDYVVEPVFSKSYKRQFEGYEDQYNILSY